MQFLPAWDVADAMRKALRTTNGLSVQDIAAHLGVSRNTVGNWLNGRIRPDERTLIAWAQLTGVPYRWLTSHRQDRDPLRARFTVEEIEEFEAQSAERGVSRSVLLRGFSTQFLSEEELELMSASTLMEMWFHNHRVFVAQRDDTAPREPAVATSITDPEMSRRIENVLNGRGMYPALELQRREDEIGQFDDSLPSTL
jgi:transcriptional regulator with XRE-family HTH domain